MFKILKKGFRFVIKFVEALIAILGQVLSSKEIQENQIKANCKIALLINFGIGNVLMVSPILKAIKIKYPDSHITIIGEESSIQIIKYNPFWDTCYYLYHSIYKNFLLFSRLNCDVFICAFPSNSFKTSVFGILSSASIRIGYSYPTLLGYSSLFFTHFLPRKMEHIVTKNINLLKFLNIRVRVEDRKPQYYFSNHNSMDVVERFIKEKNIFSNKLIAFHVGAAIGGVGRRWPLKKFDELALLLEKLGYIVLLFVGPDEMALISELQTFTSDCRIVSGISLDEVALLLKKCEFIISNDSSLMHIAAAVGTPSVGIYGPTNPRLSSPFGVIHEAVTSNIECSPCYQIEKPLHCSIRYKCMTMISAQDVLRAVEKLQKRIAQES
jgi:ADP-heptose:LPS heptosyltransferase